MDFWKADLFGQKISVPIIGDETPERDFRRTDVSYGLVPRDYSVDPPEMFEPPDDMLVFPESEFEDRIKEAWERKQTLRHHWEKADNGRQPPNLYQNGIGYCFPAGTRIRMADGSQKSIDSIRLFEEVLTAEGNIRRVMQCHAREHSGELVTIKTYGHGHLRLTPNHSVLTKRGYVPAEELAADDWIVMPRFAPQSCSIALTASHVRSARRVLVGGQEVSRSVYNDVPDVLRLTPGVGRIFGLWLAEGHIDASRNSVFWSFSVEETNTLAADLVELLRSEWGLDPHVQPGPGPNVTQVVIRGKLWCQLFRSMCGSLADGKRLHPDLACGPKDFLEAIFWGWMDGDGCYRVTQRRRPFYSGATISHDLALNMFDIANALGMNPSILREKPQKNRYAAVRRPVWKIKVTPDPSDWRPNYRMQSEPSRMWRKVRSIERERFAGTVFNIGVEGDNSYVAEGVGVHNCWSHSSTNAVMLARAVANQPYKPLSAFMVASIIKRGHDEGGWCGQSAKFIAEVGVCEQRLWPQQNRDLSLDTPEVRANAALYRITEEWRDLTRPIYGQVMTRQQVITAGLNLQAGAYDYNWWGHSVAGGVPVLIERGDIGWMILNSHGDNDGDRGWHILRGSRAWPDGAIAIRSVRASAA